MSRPDGHAAADRCYCPKPECQVSNFDHNVHCYTCGTAMPKKLILVRRAAKGGGKGGGKGDAKGKGKGKGKGKNEKPAGGKGKKGGGRASDATCSCCGVAGHFKADCRQKDKVCNSCGKTGHLAAVCRSAPAPDSWSEQPSDYTDESFAAEAARRGVDYVAPIAAPVAPAEPEHSAAAIQVKSRAKEAAAKKLDRLIDRKMVKEKELKVILEEAQAASVALTEAEQAFQEELAATNVALGPKVDPAALNIGLLLKNITDSTSLKVDFGDIFKLDDLSDDDKAVLDNLSCNTLKHLQDHVRSVYGPLKEIMDKAKDSVKEMQENAAKKRKGASGAALESPAVPPDGAAGSSASSGSTLLPASPASPSPVEKEAAAADKKAAEAATAAEAAKEEAQKAKQVALEKEQAAADYKVEHAAQLAKTRKEADDKTAQAAALQAKKKAEDKEMSDV